jgi:CheY-like chemotaxis protein
MDVLLVEDSHGDVRLAQEAFLVSETPVRLHIARDGIEAMEFLLRENLPRPDLILLDLNLPKLDGRELLLRLKEDPSLKTIPTIILSTSDAEEDVIYCYRQHANFYIKKPQQWDAFVKVVKFINNFFLLVVKPQHDSVDQIFQNIVTDRFYF